MVKILMKRSGVKPGASISIPMMFARMAYDKSAWKKVNPYPFAKSLTGRIAKLKKPAEKSDDFYYITKYKGDCENLDNHDRKVRKKAASKCHDQKALFASVKYDPSINVRLYAAMNMIPGKWLDKAIMRTKESADFKLSYIKHLLDALESRMDSPEEEQTEEEIDPFYFITKHKGDCKNLDHPKAKVRKKAAAKCHDQKALFASVKYDPNFKVRAQAAKNMVAGKWLDKAIARTGDSVDFGKSQIHRLLGVLKSKMDENKSADEADEPEEPEISSLITKFKGECVDLDNPDFKKRKKAAAKCSNQKALFASVMMDPSLKIKLVSAKGMKSGILRSALVQKVLDDPRLKEIDRDKIVDTLSGK